MSRIKLVLIILFLYPSILLAQKIHLGVKSGINFSSVGGVNNVESREGYHFGGVASFNLTENIWLHTEVTYSRQGYDISNPVIIESNNQEPDLNFRFSEKLHYVNVPVLLSYNVLENIQLQTGPQLGILIKTSEVYDFNQGSIDDLPEEFLFFGDTNSIDFGLAIGAQYNVLNFFIQGRYILGFSEVFPDFENQRSTISNRNFQISIGYYFF
jgi:opacity protein-like surface antigen